MYVPTYTYAASMFPELNFNVNESSRHHSISVFVTTIKFYACSRLCI